MIIFLVKRSRSYRSYSSNISEPTEVAIVIPTNETAVTANVDPHPGSYTSNYIICSRYLNF